MADPFLIVADRAYLPGDLNAAFSGYPSLAEPRQARNPGAIEGSRQEGSVAPLAVSDARLALADFYDVTVRIANVAARLAVLFLWLCDKLGSSTSP
jgi:hypothetical protein